MLRFKILLLLIFASTFSARAQTTGTVPTSADLDDLSVKATDRFLRVNQLDYYGFKILRRREQAQIQSPNGLTEVSSVVVQQNNKTVLTFDDLYSRVGNETEFNLFPLLGSDRKQLIVSQSVPRAGHHWVVNFGKRAEIIFDSLEFRVGREEFVENDINADGGFEIVLPSTAFTNFEKISFADSPSPEIVFEFDKKLQKFVPANPKYAAFALRDLNERIAAVSSTNKDARFGDILDIVLRRIYAGQETEGWQFYDANYNFADKAERKAKVLAVLQNEPVYKFLFPEKITVTADNLIKPN